MQETTPLLGGVVEDGLAGDSRKLGAVSSPRKSSHGDLTPADTDAATVAGKGDCDRSSVRGSRALIAPGGDTSNWIEPVDALAPLVAGGVIITTAGYKTPLRPLPVVKSLPAFAPFRRTQRHRSFYLWWINQFRHWWKSSRLLVRLAGLFTLGSTAIFFEKMRNIAPYAIKGKDFSKHARKALRVVKKLGRGGPMSFFLNYAHPFTRSVRILVGGWRWIESAKCRRNEVGAEEVIAFVGNRVSRMLARTLVDLAILEMIMPVSNHLFRLQILSIKLWHPVFLFVVFGILRACAPYLASIQGSRVGRILTRTFFKAYKNRWQVIQTVGHLNLKCEDCCEEDEISQTADLARFGRIVATALGKAQKIGIDGLRGQREALAEEGFVQVGAGSGGYAVYQCKRRIWSRSTTEDGVLMTFLLHITPHGPSIHNVMPRYVVLEFEDSVDRRGNWSEFLSKVAFDGPPVVEGYCYNGAFFSPHHFAELKYSYDKQLKAYDKACKAMCKSETGRSPSPPADLKSLKAFLLAGKRGMVKEKNKKESIQLQAEIENVAQELKSMMSGVKCDAPNGVVLYFEGLDCAGKSSTGALVEEVLTRAGYTIDTRRYNRPPTEEEKKSLWMSRFDCPDTTGNTSTRDSERANYAVNHKFSAHDHNAMVWDRGPAGDFVYNADYRNLEGVNRNEKYREFMAFDQRCFEENILFLKLLFVTNRDSIAATLGKRLAQKHMSKDLRTWLMASRGDESEHDERAFEGLSDIEKHIDPSDFLAFNNYQSNLRIFSNFAMNTESESNSWAVINTSDRFAARKQLLNLFQSRLQRFKSTNKCCRWRSIDQPCRRDTPGLSESEMLDNGFERQMPLQLVSALIGILLIVFYYCEHTTFFGTRIKDSFVWGKEEYNSFTHKRSADT